MGYVSEMSYIVGPSAGVAELHGVGKTCTHVASEMLSVVIV